MIKKINIRPGVPRAVHKKIRKLKPYKGGDWDSKDPAIVEFKSLIRRQLLKIQDHRCGFCGLPFDETSSNEIEHFVPKGGPKRPYYVGYMFCTLNLTLSCHLCNSPIKKGTYNPVRKWAGTYADLDFKIVHPMLDDPDHHYDWVIETKKVIIKFKDEKGKESIRVFKLDSTAHTEARAKQLILDTLKSDDRDELDKLIERIVTYRDNLPA
nr:hypothetical protein [uncultured Ralstonia sp.]